MYSIPVACVSDFDKLGIFINSYPNIGFKFIFNIQNNNKILAQLNGILKIYFHLNFGCLYKMLLMFDLINCCLLILNNLINQINLIVYNVVINIFRLK